MSWVLLIFSLVIALYLTFNQKFKSVIASQFAIFFYYLASIALIDIFAKSWLLPFTVLFTVGYIINLIVNIIKISNKNFDFSDEKNGKLFIKTMLQFALSLILLTIIIVLLIK